MSVTIEPADSDEVDTIADLWVDMAAGQKKHGSHIQARENRSTIREAILRHVVGGTLLIARDERTEIVGFVMFTVESGTYQQDVTRGVVENLYVLPELREEGVGASLLEAAQEELTDRGVTVVALEVMADNERAREFYRDMGYEPHRIEMERAIESDTHSKGGE